VASSNKQINAFELAVLLQKSSKDAVALSQNVDLSKLTRLINTHFAEEAPIATNTRVVTGS
jgi:hypothetical protein